MRLILILYLFIMLSTIAKAQNNKATITGNINNKKGEALTAITVAIKGTTIGTVTDLNGDYEISNIEPGNYTISVSSIGFINQTHDVVLGVNQKLTLNVAMEDDNQKLYEVTVTSASKSTLIEQKGFSVKAIETQEIKGQSIGVNTILKQSAGVGVRTSGGIGSKVNYYLSGMNGNSIETLIDYIPTDFYGSSYSVGMLPVSLIDRIDIYKGVVPVVIGTDALGGAINVITTTKRTNALDLSYSVGSFNTHRASLHGQWTMSKTGLTARLSTFYNYSDNSYKVWGTSVYVANESTGWQPSYFTEDNPATRFNDDITNYGGKVDLGFTNTKWADKFFVTVAASDLKKGVQTGQTMAKVFGAVRYDSDYLMSSVMYQKKDFLLTDLSTDVFLGYSQTEGAFVDTSSAQYNWAGEIMGYVADGGEIYSSYKSYYTETRDNLIARINSNYQFNKNIKLNICYVNRKTDQLGHDPYAASYRLPYTEPQHMYTHFTGLSAYSLNMDSKLRSNAFIKYYNYKAIINDTESESVDDEVSVAIESIHNKWGVGYAGSFTLSNNTILQLSMEKAIRLPSVEEALGSGATILNNPYLVPETSININFDIILGKYTIGYNHGVKLTLNTFYRDVENLIQLGDAESNGTAQYENIDEVLTKGLSIDIKYDFDRKLELTTNATYLDMRNNREYDYETGEENILYKDRLKNEPYLMANAAIKYSFFDLLMQNSKMNIYFNMAYTHEFYLNWPSLGDADTKYVVPTQLVFNTGLSYKLPSNKLSLAIDGSNILNEQVYDNYLLQKPGRAFYFKIAYHLQ